jgi:hypothetical protein
VRRAADRPPPFDVPLHGEPCAACGARDGGENVLVGPGHDDPTAWRQFHHDPAFLAQAAARAVHVPEVHPDQADVTGETAERQLESLLDVNPRFLGGFHAAASDL